MPNKKEAAVPAAPKPKPKTKPAAKGPVMYVGPTVPGVGIQNQVFSEIPEYVREIIKREPEVGNLFIAVKGYPEANAMLREKRGYIYSAFNKAMSLKDGGKG